MPRIRSGFFRSPYVVSEMPSVQEMLEGTHDGRLDLAVGCFNVSPDRLERYRFSPPFQEDGLAVMVVQSRLDSGRSFLAALLTWNVERYPQHPQTPSHGRVRSFRKVFQVLATGPG